MKKGQFVKCIRTRPRDFTVGKLYKVIAGEGDADISITCFESPIESMDHESFNVMDDDGDIRFVVLTSPFSKWEAVK